MNAYTQPVVDVYLAEIEAGLAARGVRGSFQVMASNGGCVSVATARRYPVRMLESGPAAGILMAARLGEVIGAANVIAFDMGGTTAKGAVVQNGEALKAYEIEVARLHEFKRGSGLPAKIPVLDMIEIGSGGGSIARVDARGVICVGPKSAGANPGPACYGMGGAQPTLTDANLVLGYYAPSTFLGGRFRLNQDASVEAINRAVAEPLGIELLQAAWGIHEVVNEDVARAVRIHASERGIDYRKSTIIAFGGSGPAHATRVARKLRIPRVVFPLGSGVMSAMGMLVSAPSFEVARSRRLAVKEATLPILREMFAELSAKAKSELSEAGSPPEQHRLVRSLDVRYVGQGFEVEVTIPDDALNSDPQTWLPGLFEVEYRKRYGGTVLRAPLEILNFKLQASGLTPSLAKIHRPGPVKNKSDNSRDAYFGRGKVAESAQVVSRYQIREGDVVIGPAFVEEDECTVVLGVGDRGTVDKLGNLIVDVSLGDLQ
jgi:N-methylhydantoinase A